MKSFTDNAGRTWMISVNVATVKRVRALCDVDLNSIVELDAQNQPNTKLLEHLSTDPVLLVDVLYAICKPECDTKNVSDEEFGRSMAGDAIEQATDALLDEIIDFFPEAKRLAFRKILAAARRFETITKKKLAALLADDQLENNLISSMGRLTGLSSKPPESAG